MMFKVKLNLRENLYYYFDTKFIPKSYLQSQVKNRNNGRLSCKFKFKYIYLFNNYFMRVRT